MSWKTSAGLITLPMRKTGFYEKVKNVKADVAAVLV